MVNNMTYRPGGGGESRRTISSVEADIRADERERIIKEMESFCKEKQTNWAYDGWSMKKLIEFVELGGERK